MRLKELEGILQQVETFSSPKIHLEQYATSPQLASHILYTAENSYGDVEGRVVGDLGCGTGIFAIGARCMEAALCVGFDMDAEALALAWRNLDGFEMDRVELVRCDVTVDSADVDSDDDDEGEDEEKYSDEEDEDPTTAGGSDPVAVSACHDGKAASASLEAVEDTCQQPICGQWSRWTKQFDTVFLNPPFGTKNNAGIDIAFLKRAIQLSHGAVYSLHKTSTRKYIEKLAKTSLGAPCQVVAELKFDLPKSYKFHRKKSVDVAVDLLRFDCAVC